MRIEGEIGRYIDLSNVKISLTKEDIAHLIEHGFVYTYDSFRISKEKEVVNSSTFTIVLDETKPKENK